MKRFKNILCVVQPGKSSAALQRAVSLAASNQATLTVVTVIDRVTAGIGMPDGGPISAELQAAMLCEKTQQLEAFIEPFRSQLKIKPRVLSGILFVEVIRAVLKNSYDLLIKSAETESWLERLFSSDDMHLLRKCPCPVWLLKPQPQRAYRRILLAIDIEQGYPQEEQPSRHQLNLQILAMASSLALSESAELHIAHAWEARAEITMRSTFMDYSEEDISAYREQQRQLHSSGLQSLIKKVNDQSSQHALDYLKPQIHLLEGSARRKIPQLAQQIEADLLVMGTVARTGISGFIMGNTAETILNQIDCSVLAIKPEGFTTPILLED